MSCSETDKQQSKQYLLPSVPGVNIMQINNATVILPVVNVKTHSPQRCVLLFYNVSNRILFPVHNEINKVQTSLQQTFHTLPSSAVKTNPQLRFPLSRKNEIPWLSHNKPMWHSMTINHRNLWQNSSCLLLFWDLIHHPLVQYFRRDVRLCFSHNLVAQLSKHHNSTVISSLFTLAIKCPAFPWPQVKFPDFPLAFPIPLLSMTFPKFPGQWEPWQFKLMTWFLTNFLCTYYYTTTTTSI